MDQKLTRMASTPHYKSYKDGKHWVTACLTSVALLGAMAIAPKASAATTEASSTDDTTPVSDESATATATKQVTLTSPTTDTQSESATADSTTPAAKPDATETDTTVGAETSDATSDATAAKAASAAIDAQQSDKTATKQDTTTTAGQNATANTATTEKKATTGFTARIGETSNVTATYVDTKTNQVIPGASGTQPVPVGTSMTIPVMSGGVLNGQPTIMKLVSYSLDGGQPISNFDPTTGPTVTIPNEANTSLQFNVEVNPVVTTVVNYQQKGTNTTTVRTSTNEVVPGLTPDEINAPSGYDTSGDVTVTVTPSDIGTSEQLSPMTFEINNATQTVLDSTKDPNGNIATYQQAVSYLAQFGIKLDGTVAIPDYMTAAVLKSITFSVPVKDEGIVNVRYTHEDQTPLDPSVPLVRVSTDGTGKTEIQANDPDNAGKDQAANLKEIILQTAATSTAPAREFIYAFDDYDPATNTFNKAFATMKTYNEDSHSYENMPAIVTDNSWYDQMAQKFGEGIPYINDATNKAVDKLVQSLSDKGIGTDGSVNATNPNFLSNLTNVQFEYANSQQNPGQVGNFTFEVKTTDGQLLYSTTKPNYDKTYGLPATGAYQTLYYPDGDANQTYYMPTDYQETLTASDGQSVTVNTPLELQIVGPASLDNLEQSSSNPNNSGSTETTNVFQSLNVVKHLYKITDPSKDSNLTLIVKLVPAQQTVDFVDDSGAKLTPTKTLNATYDPATKQANIDKLQGSDVTLANHGALKQIILESSPVGTLASQTPQGEDLGLVPAKYTRFTFNTTDPKGDVVIDAYDETPDGQHTATVSYDVAVAALKENGIGVDGTDAAPNYFMFETTQNVKFVYAKAATTPTGPDTTNPTGPDTTNPTGPDTTTPTGPDTTTPTNSSTPSDNNAGGATAPETNQGTAPAGNGSTAPADNNETAPEQTAGSNGTATNTAPTATTGNANAAGVTTPTAAKGAQSATANTNKLPQTDERANSSLALLGLSLVGLVGLGAFVSRKRRD